MARIIKCPNPRCRSLRVVPISTKQKLSLGKGLVGGLLFGRLGALAGALSGKQGPTVFRCQDCGMTFREKL